MIWLSLTAKKELYSKRLSILKTQFFLILQTVLKESFPSWYNLTKILPWKIYFKITFTIWGVKIYWKFVSFNYFFIYLSFSFLYFILIFIYLKTFVGHYPFIVVSYNEKRKKQSAGREKKRENKKKLKKDWKCVIWYTSFSRKGGFCFCKDWFV